ALARARAVARAGGDRGAAAARQRLAGGEGAQPRGRAGGGPGRGARPRLLHGHRLQPVRVGLAAAGRWRRAVRHAAGAIRRPQARGRLLARSGRAGAAGEAGMITVALPKGRTLEASLDRFARAGLVPEEDFAQTRRLIVPARGGQARFVLLKDPDVPLYVERGAADMGVCGLDHVLESAADLLVPLDLGFGACRLCLAAPRGSPVVQGWKSGEGGAELGRSLRVATKYP